MWNMIARTWFSLSRQMLLAWLVVAVAATATAQDADQSVEAEMTRGQEALNAQDFTTARDAFSKAIELSEQGLGNNPMAYIGRAVAYAALDEKEKAAADFAKAEQQSPY